MATGQIVDQRLLHKSELSDALALPDKMVTCPITSKKGIPTEFLKCEQTGDLVAPSGVATCVVTGKSVRRDLMLRSVVSGRWIMPSAAVRSIIDQQPLCPDEAAYCFWNEGYLLPSQTTTCQRTGLKLQSELVSPTGEFVYLRQLLDGTLRTADASDLIKWLRKQRGGILKETKRAWFVSSPRGGVRLVLAELHNWMGLNVRYAGIVVRVVPELAILGEVTCNSEIPPGWVKL